MSEQKAVAGWRIGVNDYDKSRNILQTTYYLVAIPDKEAMLSAICERLKLNAGAIGYQQPIAAAVLNEYGVKESEIYEWKVILPRAPQN